MGKTMKKDLGQGVDWRQSWNRPQIETNKLLYVIWFTAD